MIAFLWRRNMNGAGCIPTIEQHVGSRFERGNSIAEVGCVANQFVMRYLSANIGAGLSCLASQPIGAG